jgi:hypothetical protein
MTRNVIKKMETAQEIRIVDLASAKRRAGRPGRAAAAIVAAFMVSAVAFAAVGIAKPPVCHDEPAVPDDGCEIIPWDKPPVPSASGGVTGIRPSKLPV